MGNLQLRIVGYLRTATLVSDTHLLYCLSLPNRPTPASGGVCQTMSDDTNGVAAGSPEHYAIGVSFGNSYSSIAHISGDGKVEVIANEEGDRQIPSILSYVGGEEFHGTQAKAQLVRNSKNTIAYFRDFIGKDYKSIDPTPCHASAHPLEIDGQITFSVQEKEDEQENKIALPEVAIRHLRRLKNSASDFTGKTVNAAVVAVPTDTSEEQKAALTKAAAAIQVEILQFIPEPIAALLAYDSRSSDAAADKTVVVADFGGNRSDVAVVASRGGMYSILATAHDYELGGAQLDQVLADHFAKEFEKKNKTVPARRTKVIEGNVLLRISEGEREIKVTRPEPKEKPETNGTKEDEDEDDSDVDEDDEPEEIREKIYKPKKVLAEFVFRDLKKESKVEVMVNVDAEMSMSITARPVGGKGGVRGEVKAPQVTSNGSA